MFSNRQLKSCEKIKPSYVQFLKLLSRRVSRLSRQDSCLARGSGGNLLLSSTVHRSTRAMSHAYHHNFKQRKLNQAGIYFIIFFVDSIIVL